MLVSLQEDPENETAGKRLPVVRTDIKEGSQKLVLQRSHNLSTLWSNLCPRALSKNNRAITGI